VDVSDTGPGIAKDELPLLFQDFSRLDPGAGPGDATGLSISRRVNDSVFFGCALARSKDPPYPRPEARAAPVEALRGAREGRIVPAWPSRSTGPRARAQQHLGLVLLSTLALVMPHPGFVMGQAKEKFAAGGALAHELSREFLRDFLRDLGAWTRRQIRAEEDATKGP